MAEVQPYHANQQSEKARECSRGPWHLETISRRIRSAIRRTEERRVDRAEIGAARASATRLSRLRIERAECARTRPIAAARSAQTTHVDMMADVEVSDGAAGPRD